MNKMLFHLTYDFFLLLIYINTTVLALTGANNKYIFCVLTIILRSRIFKHNISRDP